jgi:predicted RNA-binding Zn ribbon-like protein
MVRPPPHPPAVFVADAIALDFLNSIAGAAHDGSDWISDGDGLLDWLEQTKLAPPDTTQVIREHALAGELDRVAEQARELREWFRAFVHQNMGCQLSHGAFNELAPLNRLLERGESYTQLVDATERELGFEIRALRRWRAPGSLLLPLAETIAQFVCDEDFSNVKACEGQNCSLIFVDHTRRRGRRWCSMAACGNRAKVQAHRDRAKRGSSSPRG